MYKIMNKYTEQITNKCVKFVANTVAVRFLVLQLSTLIFVIWVKMNRNKWVAQRCVSLGIS